MWTCPCAVCSLCAWRLWDRVGAEVGQGQAFPRVYWQLAVWWEVEREARSRAKCEQRLFLCSVAVHTLLDQACPKALKQKP